MEEERDMTTKQYYNIAGHTIALVADESLIAMLSNYAPFASDEGGKPVFTLEVKDGDTELQGLEEEWRQDEEGQTIVCGRVGKQPAFVFLWKGVAGGNLVCAEDYGNAFLTVADNNKKATTDNAMMVLFAMATARLATLLFHASTVSLEGKAYMFLGKSGTGKSTHSRLWLQNIEGAELVNDDNPVVRVNEDGTAVVYGSPWSGKTPCYRRVAYRLGGIVGLAQAPRNAIRRMGGIEAYALLSASVSGKVWDKGIADGLHHTLNALAMKTAVWHLDCLPDGEAARLCCEAVKDK